MLIFGSIAIVFFLIAVGGVLFGHDHDAGHDHAFDHGEPGSVSIFSTKVIATFGCGFGAAGTIASYYGQNGLNSSLIGVVFGAILGGAMYGFMNLMSKQQASSLVDTDTLVGLSGTVTTGIDADSLGEVGVSTSAGYTTFSARAANAKAIAKGRSIKVIRTSGSLLIVEEVTH